MLGDCINYNQYWSSSACNQDCQQDYNTVKWYVETYTRGQGLTARSTASSLPYCYSYLVPSISAVAFQCASTFSSDFGIMETTFAGETDGRTWSALYNTASASIFNGASTIQTTSPRIISNIPTPTPTPPTPTPTPTPQQSSSSVAPIAGGVVGGLVVVGAAAICILLLLRRRGGNAQPAAANAQYSEPMAQPPPMMAAGGGALAPPPGGFDPHDPRYSTASSAGYYKQPDGAGMHSPASYTGSPPPTYGVPGAGGAPASPHDGMYGQGQYPPRQVYSPQPQYAVQQGPPPAVSPVQGARGAVGNPYAPPRERAVELGGGEGVAPAAYAVPMTTAEGRPIYEAAGGRGR